MPDAQTTKFFQNRVETALREHSTRSTQFGKNIWDHLHFASCQLEDEPGSQGSAKARRKATVIVEATVREDWLNPVGVLHGAATAYLVDICTSLPLMALSTDDFWAGLGGLSQNMNILYHAPAPLGTKLKIISETLNVGRSVANMRCQIVDASTGKLIASGTHSKVAKNPMAAKL